MAIGRRSMTWIAGWMPLDPWNYIIYSIHISTHAAIHTGLRASIVHLDDLFMAQLPWCASYIVMFLLENTLHGDRLLIDCRLYMLTSPGEYIQITVLVI